MVIKKVKPMFNKLVTTMDRYKSDSIDEFGIINPSRQEGSLKEYQTVLEVGPQVRDIKVGDIVCINPTRYAVREHREGSLRNGVVTDNPVTRYNFETIEINNKTCLLLNDNDIQFIIAEYEEQND